MGAFTKRMGEKTFGKHPKSSTFVCIKSSLQFMHNLYPFCRNSKISRIPLIDSCETSHNRRQVPKVQVASSISKENADKGCNSI